MTTEALIGIVTVAQLVLLGGIFWFLPRWSRPELLFAVTVPPELREQAVGRRAIRTYRIGLVATLALTLGLALLVGRAGLVWLTLGATTMLLGGVTVAYLAARAVVRPHAVAPTSVREAALDAEREAFGWLPFVAPFALLVLAVVIVVVRWPSVPDPMPTRFGANGEAIAWSPKSAGPLAAPLAIGFMTLAMMPLLGSWIWRGVRRPDAANPAAIALHRRRLRAVRETLIGASWLIALLFFAIPVLQLTTDPRGVQLAIVAIVVGAHLGGLALIVWLLVRHGSAFNADARGAEAAAGGAPIGDRTDDRHWKWGVFYHNPDDPALWVEKRIGIGYTFNMARPSAWWALAAIVGLPLVATVGILWAF